MLNQKNPNLECDKTKLQTFLTYNRNQILGISPEKLKLQAFRTLKTLIQIQTWNPTLVVS